MRQNGKTNQFPKRLKQDMDKTLGVTIKTTAFALAAVLATATPSARAGGSSLTPLILAESGTPATSDCPEFPADALPRLNKVLAKPDATELKKVVRLAFDKGHFKVSALNVVTEYFQSHPDIIDSLSEELTAFQKSTGIRGHAKIAEDLEDLLEISKIQAHIAKTKAHTAKTEAHTAKTEAEIKKGKRDLELLRMLNQATTPNR